MIPSDRTPSEILSARARSHLKLPHFRFTIKRMMILVAVVASSISLSNFALMTLFSVLLDDEHFVSRRSNSFAWDAGSSPRILVELDEGYITVHQSVDGKVRARLDRFAVTKLSQSAADAALEDISCSATREDGEIRITTIRYPTIRAGQLKADIVLEVPPDASLDLLTSHGYIYIGKKWEGAMIVTAPVALKAVKARDLGNIYHGIEARLADRPSAPPTRLDLDSRLGAVVIEGRNLSVVARAGNGAIDFRGSLAPGDHRFESGGHGQSFDPSGMSREGVTIRLPPDATFEVDAESAKRMVWVAFPHKVQGGQPPRSIKARVGAGSSTRLEVRSQDEMIEILKADGPASSP